MCAQGGGRGIGAEDVVGETIELGLIAQRRLQRLDQFFEEHIEIGQRRPPLDADGLPIEFDLGRVASGAVNAEPFVGSFIKVFIVYVFDEANGEGVRVLRGHALREVAQPRHVIVRAEGGLVRGLLEVQEPVVANDLGALRGEVPPLLHVLAPSLVQVDLVTHRAPNRRIFYDEGLRVRDGDGIHLLTATKNEKHPCTERRGHR